MKRQASYFLAILLFAGAVLSCSPTSKLRRMDKATKTAVISLPERTFDTDVDKSDSTGLSESDSYIIKEVEGRQVLMMRAQEDENGEMTAVQRLKAAKVTARFRNVAERQGSVQLEFLITAPAELTRSEWQLRYRPHLVVHDTDTPLEELYITGEAFRREQLRGYSLYRRFLDRIITDSTEFLHARELAIFIQRNSKAFETDSEEAIEHYMNRIRMLLNARRLSQTDKKFRQFVKAPFADSGVRLDTLFRSSGEVFTYIYTQEIQANAPLRKAGIYVDGSLWEQDRLLCRIDASDTVTYYISSLASFARDISTGCPDSTYINGLQAIRDRRWHDAVELLRPYRDYNTAVALCGAGLNWSATELLKSLPDDAQTNYLLAIVHSRKHNYSKAVGHYLKSCRQDPAMVHRGNLDPEIHALIRKFNLNKNL